MTIAEEVKNFLHIGGEEVGKVFVLDGADPIGHRVVEKLIDTRYTNLRVGVKTLHEDMHSNSTEFVPFDWEKEDTYEPALKDVKSVFVTLPMTADFDKHFPHFLQHCTANNVKKIVKLNLRSFLRKEQTNKLRKIECTVKIINMYRIHVDSEQILGPISFYEKCA